MPNDDTAPTNPTPTPTDKSVRSPMQPPKSGTPATPTDKAVRSPNRGGDERDERMHIRTTRPVSQPGTRWPSGLALLTTPAELEARGVTADDYEIVNA